MNYTIRVIPNAGRNLVKLEEGRLKVYISAPAVDGRANQALIEILADHFKVKKRQIEIIKGLKSRDKTIKIGL